jgi:hypothetical protein
VFGCLFYLAQYTVIFFFNSALVGAALIRLDGGTPTISDGLAIAGKRMGAILGYAVLAATVGVVLNFINEHVGFQGKCHVAQADLGRTGGRQFRFGLGDRHGGHLVGTRFGRTDCGYG